MNKLKILEDIYATLKESISLQAKPISGRWPGNLEIWKSKFGGIPYWPRGEEYPRNSEGKPLNLLAQINFIDMPYLEDFPRTGLLQIYIDDDDMYGVENRDGKGFKVIYLENDGDYSNQSDLSFLQEPEYFPMECPHSIAFSKVRRPISTTNPDFDEVFKDYLEIYSDSLDFYELYDTLIQADLTHQIGGYPTFIQGEPDFLSQNKNLKLLLQIGHNEKISFGDAGIANFFISTEDLMDKDFSRIKYNWDCY